MVCQPVLTRQVSGCFSHGCRQFVCAGRVLGHLCWRSDPSSHFSHNLSSSTAWLFAQSAQQGHASMAHMKLSCSYQCKLHASAGPQQPASVLAKRSAVPVTEARQLHRARRSYACRSIKVQLDTHLVCCGSPYNHLTTKGGSSWL